MSRISLSKKWKIRIGVGLVVLGVVGATVLSEFVFAKKKSIKVAERTVASENKNNSENSNSEGNSSENSNSKWPSATENSSSIIESPKESPKETSKNSPVETTNAPNLLSNTNNSTIPSVNSDNPVNKESTNAPKTTPNNSNQIGEVAFQPAKNLNPVKNSSNIELPPFGDLIKTQPNNLPPNTNTQTANSNSNSPMNGLPPLEAVNLDNQKTKTNSEPEKSAVPSPSLTGSELEKPKVGGNNSQNPGLPSLDSIEPTNPKSNPKEDPNLIQITQPPILTNTSNTNPDPKKSVELPKGLGNTNEKKKVESPMGSELNVPPLEVPSLNGNTTGNGNTAGNTTTGLPTNPPSLLSNNNKGESSTPPNKKGDSSTIPNFADLSGNNTPKTNLPKPNEVPNPVNPSVPGVQTGVNSGLNSDGSKEFPGLSGTNPSPGSPPGSSQGPSQGGGLPNKLDFPLEPTNSSPTPIPSSTKEENLSKSKNNPSNLNVPPINEIPSAVGTTPDKKKTEPKSIPTLNYPGNVGDNNKQSNSGSSLNGEGNSLKETPLSGSPLPSTNSIANTSSTTEMKSSNNKSSSIGIGAEGYDEDLYRPGFSEKYASESEKYQAMSRKFYEDNQYWQALLLYNRENPTGNGSIRIPPIAVLEKQFARQIPHGDRSQNLNRTSIASPTGRANSGGLSTNSSSFGNDPSADWENPLKNFPLYSVVQGGETMREIAQKTLGDTSRWSRIKSLNPAVNEDEKIPANTKIYLPIGARIP